jgi:DNA-binding transcriptional LysR family regulator
VTGWAPDLSAKGGAEGACRLIADRRRHGLQARRHKLLLAGLGWCGMPEPLVRPDINAGRLVRLNLRDWRGGLYNLKAVHKIDTPPGPAGRWLIERLATLSDAIDAPVQKVANPAKAEDRRRSRKKMLPGRARR